MYKSMLQALDVWKCSYTLCACNTGLADSSGIDAQLQRKTSQKCETDLAQEQLCQRVLLLCLKQLQQAVAQHGAVEGAAAEAAEVAGREALCASEHTCRLMQQQ